MSGIRVTCTDLETGETETREIMDDYLLITAGTCYLSGVTSHGNGTHVVTVKGNKHNAPTKSGAGGC